MKWKFSNYTACQTAHLGSHFFVVECIFVDLADIKRKGKVWKKFLLNVFKYIENFNFIVYGG